VQTACLQTQGGWRRCAGGWTGARQNWWWECPAARTHAMPPGALQQPVEASPAQSTTARAAARRMQQLQRAMAVCLLLLDCRSCCAVVVSLRCADVESEMWAHGSRGLRPHSLIAPTTVSVAGVATPVPGWRWCLPGWDRRTSVAGTAGRQAEASCRPGRGGMPCPHRGWGASSRSAPSTADNAGAPR